MLEGTGSSLTILVYLKRKFPKEWQEYDNLYNNLVTSFINATKSKREQGSGTLPVVDIYIFISFVQYLFLIKKKEKKKKKDS